MFRIKRVWVRGFVAVFLLVLSFYAEFVHLASCILRCDFVEAISLSSKFDSAEVSRFGMGEDVVLKAKVWGSNFYFLDVYDENGTLVFSENGAVNSSIVETYIPLLPPAFTAKENYSVVFQSGLVNYPLLGVNTLSSSLSDFEVINSSTKLSFMAKIVSEYAGLVLPQGIASNPVQLTVSKSTRILLNVTKDDSSSEHLVEGWLVWKSFGVSGKTIKVKVNETDYTVMTGSGGYFSLSLNLQPKDDKATTYIVTASFEDEATQPINATAWACTLDGQQFAACTTIQYGFKPSSNMTTLTVDPRVTELMRLAKSPEEMQKQAEQNGQLRIWHEWSWWYPGYRMHFVIVLEAGTVLDIGLTPLGCDVINQSPTFNSWINDFINAILKAYVIGWITTEAAVWAAMWCGPPAFLVAFLGSVAFKSGLLASAWNSVQDLKSSFIGAWASLILGMVGVVRMLHSGIVSLAFGFLEVASKVDFWKFIYKFVYVPINMIFLMLIINRLSQLGGL